MKYLSFLTCAVIFFICLNGCAGSHTNFVSSVKAAKKKLTYAQSLANELAALSRPPVRTTVEGRQEVAQMGSGNSIIQTMYDAFGNKTESRVFYNNSLLKMIVLKTSARGQQEAVIYGQNGEVKVAPQSLLDKVLTSVAGEIAKSVEIFEVRKEDEMLAKLEIPATVPTKDILTTNLNQPIIEETAPVVETKPAKDQSVTETVTEESAKVETKTAKAEDSAAQLRSAVQSLRATRKTPANSATNDLVAKAN